MPVRERAIGPDVTLRISARIRELRQERNWSMSDLSDALSKHRCAVLHPDGCRLSVATINQVENGVIVSKDYRRVRILSADEVVAFAHVYNVTVAELFGED